MRIVCTILALILFASTQISAQSETSYDIEHECICLIDSIAPDTIVQFWRFTQSNNPGGYTVDVTFDFGNSYLVEGTLLSCKDYYLGDNPGGSGTANTLTMWTGTSSLGNSSVTQSGQILSTSLTGAFKLPIHTTAGRPVGVSGYLANNSTENGIEGYNGGNWYFLPWSDADNWTSGYVPFSDGSKLTASNQIIFSSNELRIGNAADMGGYILQVAGNSKYTSRGEFVGSQTLSNMLTVQNTYSGTSYAMDASGYSAGIVASATNTETSIYAAQSGSISTNTVAISINNRDSPVGSSDRIINLGGSRQILWQYGRQNAGASPAYNYTAAFIRPIVADNHYGNQDVSLEFGISKQNASTKVMVLDSAGLVLQLYGSGSRQGVPAYTTAVTSAGRVVEIAFAYGEMYIDDSDTDTITFAGGSTTPAQSSDWLSGDLSNFTRSNGRLTYTGTETAMFLINTSISASFSENNTSLETWIYKGGSELAGSEAHNFISTADIIIPFSNTALVQMATNEYVEFFAAPGAHTGDDLFIIHAADINIVKL